MINTTRVGAVIRKELAEIRRNRFILVTACILPIIFLVEPTVAILLIKASATSATLATRVDTSLFLPLLVPVLIPATMSAFSVVGEREQGTLEPVLTTPVTRVEFILGKAAAIFMPAVGLSYLVLGVFIAIVALFARPAVATEMWNAPQLPAEAVFIPLLAAWAIWVGLSVSSLVSDTRVAQQLSVLASLPPMALIALMSFQIITPSLWLAVALALALLAIDCGACFVVARLFDRERLVTGTRPTRRAVAGGTVRRLPPVGQTQAEELHDRDPHAHPHPVRHRHRPLDRQQAGEWQVIVDGTVAGSIAPQETVEVPVEPGRHTLRLRKSRRFLSPERSFEAADEADARFHCRMRDVVAAVGGRARQARPVDQPQAGVDTSPCSSASNPTARSRSTSRYGTGSSRPSPAAASRLPACPPPGSSRSISASTSTP